MSETVLRATDVSAGYGGPMVIHDITIELTPGTPPQGIIGPSGAGKSTIARVLRGRVKPSYGHVTFGGRTVGKMGRKDKKNFGALVRSVSQDGLIGVDPRWTVEKLMKDALADARKAGRANGRPIPDLLAEVMLDPWCSNRVVRTLSGGEKQRLALAVALATRPAVLILDEPLTAVDPGMRGEVVRGLASVVAEQGTAVLLVSHDLELVERLCPTVSVLSEGAIVASGSLREIFAESEHPTVRELAEAAPLAAQRFR